MTRNVIVTGGAGFIGSAVCRHLVERRRHVVNVDNLTYAANLRLPGHDRRCAQLPLRQGRHLRPRAIDEAFASFAPDHVIHLAAESHVDRSITGSGAFHPDQCRRHLHAARGGARLLASHCRGKARGVPLPARLDRRGLRLAGQTGLFTETTPYAPSSPYSASKAASDHLVTAWRETYGLPTLVSNCSNNYGPYHFPEKLIPLIILNALRGEPLPVYGDGANVRDWLYVDDHAKALRDDPRPTGARPDLQRRRAQRAQQHPGGRGDLRSARRALPRRWRPAAYAAA